MKDFVSNYLSIVLLAASLAVACIIVGPYGFPWMGLGGLSLAISTAIYLTSRSTRSIRQVIQEVEIEPVLGLRREGTS